MAKKQISKKEMCCSGHASILPLVIFIISVLWLLGDLNIIAFKLPWLAIIATLVSLTALVHAKKCC